VQPRLVVEDKLCLEQYGVPPQTTLHALKISTEDQDTMSLFSHEEVLTKEIESWKGFADSLPAEEEREMFLKMLNDCYRYAKAINVKGQPFPVEPVIMALLFSQHKMIEWLEGQISKPKINILKPLDQSINEISHNYRLSD
jgi:hypothetical protein